jgi:protoporphyrin/coproporphyrin ferrochelatase
MSFYLPEPPFRHDQPSRVGILLINLGTPEAPTAQALRPYLKEFLWDRRVVEIPRLAWWPILNGIILNTRPKKSAEKYASIWRPEGSPLKYFTERQSQLLGQELSRRIGMPLLVDYAMRYGRPTVAEKIMAMKAQGMDRLLVVPLYPQYAASSSGSALDAVWENLLHTRNPPEVRTLRHFHDDPGYIAALRQSIDAYWAQHGRPDVLVMSFHGVPRRSLDLGDPYHCECQKTGRLLAESLGLTDKQYRITFQSRFGKAEWLQPYTDKTLEELGRSGTKRLDIVCPGFVADCLETLEEIALEGKASFLNAGGGEFRHIPALNDRPFWIGALADLTLRHLAGWLPENSAETTDTADLDSRLTRARALGAKN